MPQCMCVCVCERACVCERLLRTLSNNRTNGGEPTFARHAAGASFNRRADSDRSRSTDDTTRCLRPDILPYPV